MLSHCLFNSVRRKEKGSSQKDQSPSLFLQVRSGTCQIESNTLNKGFLIKKNIFVFYIVLLFLSVIFIDSYWTWHIVQVRRKR